MLEMKLVHAWELDKPEKMVRVVFDHYSFTDGLSSELLEAWPAARIKRFDINGDSMIDQKELNSANDTNLDGQFQFSLPDVTGKNTEKQSVNFQTIDDSVSPRWHGHPTGGRLTLDGCIVTIVLSDDQSEAVKALFKTQYGRIGEDAQIRTVAMQALELKEGLSIPCGRRLHLVKLKVTSWLGAGWRHRGIGIYS